MKKLIVLFTFLCISCAKETKEEDPQVAQLKNSIAGTTWTYYYKNPFGQFDITSYTFSPTENRVTIRKQSEYGNYDNTKVWSYKYEYPNLYIENPEYPKTEKYTYKVDANKKEITTSNKELPLKQGDKSNLQPYTLDDLISRIPIRNSKDFWEKETEWVSERSKDRILLFVMNAGISEVFHKAFLSQAPYKKGNDYFIVSYDKLEYPNIYLKLEYLKEVPKDTTFLYNTDDKYFIEDKSREPISDRAEIKNNDKEIEFNGETFYRVY
jgi:hypothetical protein